MNAATSEMDAQVETNDEGQFSLTDEQLSLIGGGQCTTNSI